MSTLEYTFKNLAAPQRITLSSGPLAYRKGGSGPPLILVHGWGGSSRHWFTTLAHFAELRTIYAMDLPGHGESPPLAEVTSAERIAELIIEFADAMQLDTFDVNGHSFGAAVAVYLAARYPQRVRRLIISSFGVFDTPLERMAMGQMYIPLTMAVHLWHPWLALWKPWQMYWQLWMVGAGYNPLVPWMISRAFFFAMPADIELIQEGYNEFMLMDQRTSLENTISLGNPALHDALKQISAPTLLIAGRQDMIVLAETVQAAARLVPHCRVEWVEWCGHVPMIEQPDTYHHAVDGFLNEQIISQAAA
jgi:pimeloyl-ACP methyl ester carboxylesterase